MLKKRCPVPLQNADWRNALLLSRYLRGSYRKILEEYQLLPEDMSEELCWAWSLHGQLSSQSRQNQTDSKMVAKPWRQNQTERHDDGSGAQQVTLWRIREARRKLAIKRDKEELARLREEVCYLKSQLDWWKDWWSEYSQFDDALRDVGLKPSCIDYAEVCYLKSQLDWWTDWWSGCSQFDAAQSGIAKEEPTQLPFDVRPSCIDYSKWDRMECSSDGTDEDECSVEDYADYAEEDEDDEAKRDKYEGLDWEECEKEKGKARTGDADSVADFTAILAQNKVILVQHFVQAKREVQMHFEDAERKLAEMGIPVAKVAMGITPLKQQQQQQLTTYTDMLQSMEVHQFDNAVRGR